MNRRNFLRDSAITAAGISLLPQTSFASGIEKVRLGYIGVGGRGRSHIEAGLKRTDVEIVAICDTQEESLKVTRGMISRTGRKMPAEYTGSRYAYKKLLDRKDIDAVIISTPWEFHKEQSIYAMRAGIYVGCEVVAGITLEDHWEIANVYEETKIPYMTLENVCYRRDVMAVLHMVRQNMFGELIHVQGGYQHELMNVLFHGVEYGPQNPVGEWQWRTQHNIDRNGDLYPTHGAGPVMNYININKGNRFTNLVSFSSKARGLANYVNQRSPGHPNSKINYKNGDVVTTMLNCENGETVTLTHDTHLPRPYSLGFRVQGTEGIWMDLNNSVFLQGRPLDYDENDKANSWIEKNDHPLWKRYAVDAAGFGHGGMDWFVFNAFVIAVKEKRQTPIDVYDSLTMSVITPLSEKSLAEGNLPQQFPDFTKGKWKTAKPVFALDDSGF